VALDAVEKVRQVVPLNVNMASFALRWILEFGEVSCVIPGARNDHQVLDNIKAAELPALTSAQMDALERIYQDQVRALVHQRW
jgi:aryl-alcohol dehydrogenase-like predicted oxidoreductase